jgi:hypothetical protein
MSLLTKLRNYFDPSIVTDKEFDKIIYNIFYRGAPVSLNDGRWFCAGAYSCCISDSATLFEINKTHGFSKRQRNKFIKELQKFRFNLIEVGEVTWGPATKGIRV